MFKTYRDNITTESGLILGRLENTAILLTGLALIVKGLGIFREMVFASTFGVTADMDAFICASVVPVAIGMIIQTGLPSAIIPIYSDCLARQDQAGIRNLTNNTFGWIVVFAGSASMLCGFFAADIVALISPGFSPAIRGIAADLIVIMSPAILLSSMLGLLTALQQANDRFILPAIAQIPASLILIGSVLIFDSRLGVYSAGCAFTVSLLFQVVIQYSSLLTDHVQISPQFCLSYDIRKLGFALGPILLGSACAYINLIVGRVLVSFLPAGSMSSLDYSSKVVEVIGALLTSSVCTVLFPTISKQLSQKDVEGYRKSVLSGVCTITYITLPLAVFVAVCRTPIIEVLFERGAFDAKATEATAQVLLYLSAAIVTIPLQYFLSQLFWASHNSKIPLQISGITVCFNIASNIALIGYLGSAGVALATSLAGLVGVACLWTRAESLLGIQNRWIWSRMEVHIVAAVIMGAMVHLLNDTISMPASGINALDPLFKVSLLAFAGSLLFFAVTGMMDSEETKFLWKKLLWKK